MKPKYFKGNHLQLEGRCCMCGTETFEELNMSTECPVPFRFDWSGAPGSFCRNCYLAEIDKHTDEKPFWRTR